MARDNFLEKCDGPSRTPKTFVELKNIYLNSAYNKKKQIKILKR